MINRAVSIRRVLVAIVTASLLGLILAGCATNSPPEQAARERKAASVPVFKLHMTKDLWSRTNSSPSHRKIDKPRNLIDRPDGMVTIELTGPQMVDYLQILDFNAHGGLDARDVSLAASVYDAAAPVIDQIQAPPAPGAPVPEITVHAAVAPATTTPPR